MFAFLNTSMETIFSKRASLLSIYEMKLTLGGIFPHSVGSKMILFISQWLLWNLKGNQFLWKQTEWLNLKRSTMISFLQLHWLHQLSIKSVFFFFFNFTDYVVKLNRHQLATLCFTKQNHKYFCSSFMKWIKKSQTKLYRQAYE